MPRRISIEPHLSIDELENRYRQSKDAIARMRVHVPLGLSTDTRTRIESSAAEAAV